MTLSVMFPVMPERIEDLVRFARHVADGPCHRLWMGQTLTYETFQALAYLAGAEMCGCRWGPEWRSPRCATRTRRPSRPARWPSSWDTPWSPRSAPEGSSWPRTCSARPTPARRSAVAEYLTVARHTLAGEYFEFHGEYHRVSSGLYPVRHPGVELGARRACCAPAWPARRAPTRRCGGDLADPSGVPGRGGPARPGGGGALERAGALRASPRWCTRRSPGRAANPRRLAYLGNAGHLVTDHYVDMLRRAGLDVSADDPEKGAQALRSRPVSCIRRPGPHRARTGGVPRGRGGRGGAQPGRCVR
ncbi:hypothetical protein SVIOM74S_06514 [Streptomyces violarus]